jgi:hypothetical protein
MLWLTFDRAGKREIIVFDGGDVILRIKLSVGGYKGDFREWLRLDPKMSRRCRRRRSGSLYLRSRRNSFWNGWRSEELRE